MRHFEVEDIPRRKTWDRWDSTAILISVLFHCLFKYGNNYAIPCMDTVFSLDVLYLRKNQCVRAIRTRWKLHFRHAAHACRRRIYC